uniref:Uncharacterized protein n=1 Tax=Laticauda laticaudata TaxID=8630 RepID=A0A8C5RIH4_LATLA
MCRKGKKCVGCAPSVKPQSCPHKLNINQAEHSGRLYILSLSLSWHSSYCEPSQIPSAPHLPNYQAQALKLLRSNSTYPDWFLCLSLPHILEHPGVCPRRVEVFPFIPCKNTCNNDHDCRLTEKCCFTGCSRGCLPSAPEPEANDRCRLPRDQGSCSKELQHFYYDPEEKKCISFVYHGCEGNSNNFETRELCEKTCGKISKGTEDECCPLSVCGLICFLSNHCFICSFSFCPPRPFPQITTDASLFGTHSEATFPHNPFSATQDQILGLWVHLRYGCQTHLITL